jgi:Protein of unknown function (DUF1501)
MKPNLNGCGTHGAYTRRHFLFGSLAAASTSLLRAHPDSEVTTNGAAPRKTARACIFVTLNGAASHLDMFDPKDGPWNPDDADLREYPGGLVLSRKFFPNLSRITSDLLVLRSLTSWEAAHDRGTYYLQTNHSFNPAFAREIPHIGAVIAKEKAGTGKFPPFLGLNSTGMRGSTFLGGRYTPLQPFVNPNGLNTLRHDFYGNTSQQIFEQKFSLMQTLDSSFRQAPYNQAMADYADFYAQAKGMMYQPDIDAVFKFTADDHGRYGSSTFGDCLCVARNAVRAKNGMVFTYVNHYNWDNHANLFDKAANQFNHYRQTNEIDVALYNLVQDLRASGDLNSTLIVIMSEFGRTPGLLNTRGGRDHFKDIMSAVLIGGGVSGGRAIGKTDATSSAVTDPGWSGDRVMQVEDVVSTIYSALGVDWTKSIVDTPSGRKFFYVEGAPQGLYQPIEEVFG